MSGVGVSPPSQYERATGLTCPCLKRTIARLVRTVALRLVPSTEESPLHCSKAVEYSWCRYKFGRESERGGGKEVQHQQWCGAITGTVVYCCTPSRNTWLDGTTPNYPVTPEARKHLQRMLRLLCSTAVACPSRHSSVGVFGCSSQICTGNCVRCCVKLLGTCTEYTTCCCLPGGLVVNSVEPNSAQKHMGMTL